MNIKKGGVIFVAAAMCAVLSMCAWSLYEQQYPILPDHSNLLEELNLLQEHYPGQTRVSAVYDVVSLGDDQVVLIELDDEEFQSQLGMAELKRGMNGNYQVGWMVYGTEKIHRNVLEVGGTVYYLAGGQNPGRMIRTFTFAHSPNGEEISIELPEDDQFLVAIPLERDWLHGPANCRFYNADGEDITSEIEF